MSFHKSFSCEKKIPLSREEKTQQTTSEKEKENHAKSLVAKKKLDGMASVRGIVVGSKAVGNQKKEILWHVKITAVKLEIAGR